MRNGMGPVNRPLDYNAMYFPLNPVNSSDEQFYVCNQTYG